VEKYSNKYGLDFGVLHSPAVYEMLSSLSRMIFIILSPHVMLILYTYLCCCAYVTVKNVISHAGEAGEPSRRINFPVNFFFQENSTR
jgi:hypothetical protein